jgi:hypothetical protein
MGGAPPIGEPTTGGGATGGGTTGGGAITPAVVPAAPRPAGPIAPRPPVPLTAEVTTVFTLELRAGSGSAPEHASPTTTNAPAHPRILLSTPGSDPDSQLWVNDRASYAIESV